MKKLGLAAGRPSTSKSKAAAMQAVSNDNEELIRVTVELPPELQMRLKMYAIKNRTTMSKVLRELIDKDIPK
jgi:hypothetical protein